ncbi:MAG: DNA translocase FtsK 4TM domain-containing protein, partial [Acidimicrobiales bacterium]
MAATRKRRPAGRRSPPSRRPARPRSPAARRRPAAPKRPSLGARIRAGLARCVGRQADDVWGLSLLVAGLLAALGIYADLAGPAGGALGSATGRLLGWARFLVPAALAGVGLSLVRGRPRAEPGRAVVGSALALVAGAGLGHLLGGTPRWDAEGPALRRAGGWLGVAVGGPLRALLSPWGAGLVLVSLAIVAVLVLTRTPARAGA